jgi:hypothetical protein
MSVHQVDAGQEEDSPFAASPKWYLLLIQIHLMLALAEHLLRPAILVGLSGESQQHAGICCVRRGSA